MLSMSKLIRVKYKKEDEMIFISHLDLQRLLQRAFRRAKINLSYSEGFNPHPKMSYGNALALGVESQGEYVDIEIEDDIEVKEFLERINEQLPDGIKFVKGQEIDPKTPSLSSIIVYGEYIFNILSALSNSVLHLFNLYWIHSSRSLLILFILFIISLLSGTAISAP